MYRIEIRSTEAEVSASEEDFFKALAMARSMVEYDGYGKVKSAEIYEDDRVVASLRTFK